MKAIMLFSLLSLVVFTNCKKEEPVGNGDIINYSFTVSPYQWSYDDLYDRYYHPFYTTESTNSAVLGYVMSGSGEQVLPYVECNDWDCSVTSMATNLFRAVPYIEFQYQDQTDFAKRPTDDVYFYLVIIPPAMKKSNVDHGNYKAVKSAYNLQ